MIIYLPLFIIVISFFIYAYAPRKISRRYLKDDPIKIYCCYRDVTEKDGVVREIDFSKKDEAIKMIKKVYYVPYYYVLKDKTERASFKYYCFQYENYYIIVSQFQWIKIEGIYSNYAIIEYDYYNFSNYYGITKHSLKNFDFDEWKELLL